MQIHSGRSAPLFAVTVDAPARLHLGFLDPNGSLGRSFGSVGLVIDGHSTRVSARLADRTHVEGTCSDEQHARIERYLDLLQVQFGGPPVAVEVHLTPRAHTGLGSGTQLALAVGTAFGRLLGRQAASAELAQLLGRGLRSGIGVLGFDHGGLLVDGGPGRAMRLAPLLFRQPFPDEWRILLVDDSSRDGLHGNEERRALASLAPFPQTLAAHLCHLVLMRILPGAAEADFETFARGVSELQRTIGEYFAPAQGGLFSSPAVARALEAVAAQQTAGIGQTSWGPTGFALLPSAEHAERARAAACEATRGMPGVTCSIVTARNRGASARVVDLQQCGVDAG
jgi:beta-ribofuranosylaminobenzene 5'-phosphate synthase